MTDHDGRLCKFGNKFIPISNEKFSVDYIIPNDGEHRIILQLYKNTTYFAISSFPIEVAHPSAPDNLLNQLFQDRPF